MKEMKNNRAIYELSLWSGNTMTVNNSQTNANNSNNNNLNGKNKTSATQNYNVR